MNMCIIVYIIIMYALLEGPFRYIVVKWIITNISRENCWAGRRFIDLKSTPISINENDVGIDLYKIDKKKKIRYW